MPWPPSWHLDFPAAGAAYRWQAQGQVVVGVMVGGPHRGEQSTISRGASALKHMSSPSGYLGRRLRTGEHRGLVRGQGGLDVAGCATIASSSWAASSMARLAPSPA